MTLHARRLITFVVVAALVPATAEANGRPPITNGVTFESGAPQASYVATTFGFLVSPDSCHFYWLCEDDIGFGGEFDPAYGVTAHGTLLATTFHGLRVSRDGGCSFQTVASTANQYLDALDIGPTGEVWAGTSDAAYDNAVLRSADDAATFAPRGALPNYIWYRSIKVAPNNAARVYVAGYQINSSNPDAGLTSPSAHLFRTDDDGVTWTELPLAGIAYGSVPRIAVAAVAPTNAQLMFLRSEGAAGAGDRLYRSLDGGATVSEVLSTTDPITGVVIREPNTVFAATQLGGAFRSDDGGTTFQSIANPPQLACLGQRADGALIGCGAPFDPDHMAVATSSDGITWQPLLRLEYLTGPLSCPVGTLEHDRCDQELWRGLASQLGVINTDACAGGPDGMVDAPPLRPRSRGCCEAGGESTSSLLLTVGTAIALLRRRDGGLRWR